MAPTRLGVRVLSLALFASLLPAAVLAQDGVDDPVPLEGLAVWLRAGEGVAESSGALATWADQSGNGRDGAARGPVVPTLAPDGVNGCPAVRFDAGGDVLLDLDISPATRPELTVFTVFTTDVADGTFRKLYGHDDGGFDRAVGIDDRADTGFGVFTGSGVGDFLDPPVGSPLLHVDTWTPTTFTGESLPSGATTTLAVSNGAGLAQLSLGSSGEVFDEYWDGLIAEFIVYERTLSDDETDQVVAHLTDSYGLDGGAPTCSAEEEPGAEPTDPDAGPPATAPALDAAQRIAGTSRFDTAALAALDAFPEGADSVLLASGRSFADVAAAAGLAGVLGAPILLTEPDRLPDVTRDAFARLRPSEIIILGGEAAVSADLEFDLRLVYTGTRRISGPSRFATAANIGLEAGPFRVGRLDGEPTAVIATGRDFPDALAAGPVAYAGRFPVLLTEPDRLPEETRDALTQLGIQRVVIVGGTAVVNEIVEQSLRDVVTTVTRLSGNGREATAAAVADFGVAELGLLADGTVLLADGGNFPDALAGGPHGGEALAPILLSSHADVPPATQAWVDANAASIERVRALGGTAAVPDVVLGTLAPGVKPREVDLIIPPEDADGLVATALLPDSADIGVTALSIYDELSEDAPGGAIVASGPDGAHVATIIDDAERDALLITAADGSVIQLGNDGAGAMRIDWVNAEGGVGGAQFDSESLSTLDLEPVISPFVPETASFAGVGAGALRVPIHGARALIRVDVDPPLRADAVMPGLSFDVVCDGEVGTLCTSSGFISGGLPIATVRMQHFVQAGNLQDTTAETNCLNEEAFTTKVKTILDNIVTAHGSFVTIGVLLAALANTGSIGALIGSIAAAAPVAGVIAVAGLLASVVGVRAELVRRHCARVGNEQAALDALGVSRDAQAVVDITPVHPLFDFEPGLLMVPNYQPFAEDFVDGARVADFVVTAIPREDLPDCPNPLDPRTTATTAPPGCELAGGAFAPVIVNGTGTGGRGIYAVVRESEVDAGTLRNCDFRHGGLCDETTPPSTFTPLSGIGLTVESATRVVCERFDHGSYRSPPLAAGRIADIGGEAYTVDDRQDLDGGLCNQIVNG